MDIRKSEMEDYIRNDTDFRKSPGDSEGIMGIINNKKSPDNCLTKEDAMPSKLPFDSLGIEDMDLRHPQAVISDMSTDLGGSSVIKMYYPTYVTFRNSNTESPLVECVPKVFRDRSTKCETKKTEILKYSKPVVIQDVIPIEIPPTIPEITEDHNELSKTEFPSLGDFNKTMPLIGSTDPSEEILAHVNHKKSANISINTKNFNKRVNTVEHYGDNTSFTNFENGSIPYVRSTPYFNTSGSTLLQKNISLDDPYLFNNNDYNISLTSNIDDFNDDDIYFYPATNFDSPSISTFTNETSKEFKKVGSEDNGFNVRSRLSKSVESCLSNAKLSPDETDPYISADEAPFLIERNHCAADLAKDQHGSRLLQHRIEHATEEDLTSMVYDIVDDVTNLVLLVGDVFGNYVIQKLIEYGSDSNRLTIMDKLNGHILKLALQMYGCRVIQRAIECGGLEIQFLVISELKGHVLECIKDQNGNHVIQKCIEKVPPLNLEFIIMEISSNVVDLSSHSYGCRVIQRVLEYFTDEQKSRVTEELYLHVADLVMDQYGNYVVQHILDHCPMSPHRDYVFSYICRNLFKLSSHKFASNVVEKSLVSGDPEQRKTVMNEIFKNSTGKEDDMIYKMMKDPFANYVIQKMIDVIVKEKHQELLNTLVSKIKPHSMNLRKITYGKHILNKIEKICSKWVRSPNAFSKSESYDHVMSTFRNSQISNPRISQSQDYSNGLSSVKSQNHVICDSLSEFPSLIGGNKMSVSSD